MIKKYMAIFACALMLLLTACGNKVKNEVKNEVIKDEPSMFVIVEEVSTLWNVVYNRDTKVMYAVSRGGYNTGNFTLLVNPDGTPMIWEGKR